MPRRSKYSPLVEEADLVHVNSQYAIVKHNDDREATVSFRHLAPASTSSDICSANVDNSNLNKNNNDANNKDNNLTNNYLYITLTNGTERDYNFSKLQGVDTSDIVVTTKEIIQARQRACYYDTEIQSSERLVESTDVTES
ncbi:hypothetical protein GJ496_000139 [Pomphorhynchus laevis]|nr:hypothetical protein GJ496_000139 [Pomphorhynchus laevis]